MAEQIYQLPDITHLSVRSTSETTKTTHVSSVLEYLFLSMNAGLDGLLQTRCHRRENLLLRTYHLYSLLVRLNTERFEHHHYGQVLYNTNTSLLSSSVTC